MRDNQIRERAKKPRCARLYNVRTFYTRRNVLIQPTNALMICAVIFLHVPLITALIYIIVNSPQ